MTLPWSEWGSFKASSPSSEGHCPGIELSVIHKPFWVSSKLYYLLPSFKLKEQVRVFWAPLSHKPLWQAEDKLGTLQRGPCGSLVPNHLAWPKKIFSFSASLRSFTSHILAGIDMAWHVSPSWNQFLPSLFWPCWDERQQRAERCFLNQTLGLMGLPIPLHCTTKHFSVSECGW